MNETVEQLRFQLNAREAYWARLKDERDAAVRTADDLKNERAALVKELVDALLSYGRLQADVIEGRLTFREGT
jgi:cell division protein FtsB